MSFVSGLHASGWLSDDKCVALSRNVPEKFIGSSFFLYLYPARYIPLCAMVSNHLWTICVIFGQLVSSVMIETHVWLVSLPGNRSMIYRRCHAIKLIKAVVYTLCIPFWWLIPLSYNNPIGNERVWAEYSVFVT
jgi:hypothetical protein